MSGRSRADIEAPPVESAYPAANPALASYQELVRQVALEVQSEQGWCDDGFNQAMRKLGLPEKKEFSFDVEVVTRRTSSTESTVYINDAQTEEEARGRVTDEYVKENFVGPGRELMAWRIVPPPRPEVKEVEVNSSGDRVVRTTSGPCSKGPDCDVCYRRARRGEVSEQSEELDRWLAQYGAEDEQFKALKGGTTA